MSGCDGAGRPVLCDLLASLLAPWGTVACSGLAGSWVDILVLVMAGLSVAVALLGGGSRSFSLGRAALLVLAVAALALAARDPGLSLASDAQAEGGLQVLLLDGSESVWRDPATPIAALKAVSGQLDKQYKSMSGAEAADWRGMVIRFGTAAQELGAAVALTDHATVVARLNETDPAPGSNISAGLDRALESIRAAGGRGVINLVSDGLFPAGLPDAALVEARNMGVPIHVMPTGASHAGAGLMAADIGPEQWMGREVAVRATVLGGGRIGFRQGWDERGEDLAVKDRMMPVRGLARFSSRGLRSVVVSLDSAEGGLQEVPVYTLVRGPARLLVFGTAPWADGLDPARWIVTRADAARPPDLAGQDVILIDTLSPSDFPTGFITDLLKVVEGTGLMIVNGPIRGTKEEPQRIADWNATGLSPILPVDSDPRKFVAEPPPRDVVILIDVSGSMAGAPLAQAVAVAELILAQLRPQDTVAILPFASGSMPGFARRPAGPGALAEARGFLASLSAGSGTDPTQTLNEAARLASNYCAFFFLSDGGFILPPVAPRCFTTAIGVDGNSYPSGVSAWGEEISLATGTLPSGLKLRYFEPEVREEYFREGRFIPMPATATSGLVPSLPVDGLAIAYPRADATISSLHSDPPPDPLLAFRRDGTRPGIVTAAFLSAIPENWGSDPEGRQAIDAMLSELTGWTDQDRYDLRLRFDGRGLELTLRLLQRPLPGQAYPSTIEASLSGPDGLAAGFGLRSTDEPGVYRGRIAAPFAQEPRRGVLTLREADRPVQRIPVDLPAIAPRRAQSGEQLDWGIDRAVLEEIAARTGGVMMDVATLPVTESVISPGRELHFAPWLLLIASLSLASAFWVGGRR